MTDLQKFALQIRIEQLIAFKARGFGHIGGSLSATDLISALYGDIMKYNPQNPSWEKRDRFVCSKGHAGPALYAALALKGFFDSKLLQTLNQPHTTLPSHCDKNLTIGIDATTGSLGQGASVAAGIAHGLKLNHSDSHVYLLMGDGECNEGQVWEMALYAPAKKLNNLIAFVDYNHMQLDGRTEDILDMGDIRAKFNSFGWYAMSINGNDPDKIAEAIRKAQAEQDDKPACIVMETVKGYGIKDVVDMPANHHINISPEQADKWTAELEEQLAAAGK